MDGVAAVLVDSARPNTDAVSSAYLPDDGHQRLSVVDLSNVVPFRRIVVRRCGTKECCYASSATIALEQLVVHYNAAGFLVTYVVQELQ